MTINAYTIAVTMTLNNKVNGALMSMASSLRGLSPQFDQLQNKLNSIQRLASNGQAFMGAGIGMAASLKHPLERAMELERIKTSLMQKGLGDEQIKDALKYAQANEIIGTSFLERAHIFNDAQGSFRESGKAGAEALEDAKKIMPALAMYQSASQLLDGKSQAAVAQSFQNLNKVIEMEGGLGSPKRAQEIADAVFKAVQGSGHMVDERQIKLFDVQGGAAVRNLSLESKFAALEPLMGMFSGNQLGTGLQTGYLRTNGMLGPGQQSKFMMHEALRLGLWDKNQIAFKPSGAVDHYKGNPLVKSLQDLQATDFLGFVKAIKALYTSHGITKQQDMDRETQIIFGRADAKVMSMAMTDNMIKVMEKSVEAFRASQSASGLLKKTETNPLMMYQDALKKWDAAMVQLGIVVLPMTTQALLTFVPYLRDFSKWIGNNTETVKFLTYAFLGLAGALTFGGTVMLLTSAFRGLAFAFQLIGLMSVNIPAVSLAFRGLSSALTTGIFNGTAGLTSLATGLTGVAGTLGLVTLAAQVMLAAGLGAIAGKIIYENMSRENQDTVGGTMATIMAGLGSEDAQEALNRMSKGQINANDLAKLGMQKNLLKHPEILKQKEAFAAMMPKRDLSGSDVPSVPFPNMTQKQNQGQQHEDILGKLMDKMSENQSIVVKNFIDGKEVANIMAPQISRGTAGFNTAAALPQPAMGGFAFGN